MPTIVGKSEEQKEAEAEVESFQPEGLVCTMNFTTPEVAHNG